MDPSARNRSVLSEASDHLVYGRGPVGNFQVPSGQLSASREGALLELSLRYSTDTRSARKAIP
jgi:hypothetical protein